MNAYFFQIRSYPEAEIKSRPGEFIQGAYVLSCVIDNDAEHAEWRIRCALTLSGWMAGPSRLLDTVEVPEAGPLQQPHQLDKFLFPLLRESLDHPDVGLAFQGYSKLRSDNQFDEPLSLSSAQLP